MDETRRRLTSNRARNKYKREKEQCDLHCQKPKVKTRAPDARWKDTIDPKPTSKRKKPHMTQKMIATRNMINLLISWVDERDPMYP
jgi:hypothetical protein